MHFKTRSERREEDGRRRNTFPSKNENEYENEKKKKKSSLIKRHTIAQ